MCHFTSYIMLFQNINHSVQNTLEYISNIISDSTLDHIIIYMSADLRKGSLRHSSNYYIIGI